MLQAYSIAYNKSETIIALGMPSGLIQLHQLDEDTGRPGDVIHYLESGTVPVSHLTFWADDSRLLSLSATGKISIWDIAEGSKVNEVAIPDHDDDEACDASGSLSPCGATYFVGCKHSYKNGFYAVDLASGTINAAPVETNIYTALRPYAIDAKRCYFHYLQEDEDADLLMQYLSLLDFSTSEWTRNVLGGMMNNSLIWRDPLFDLSLQHNCAIRQAHDSPVEQAGDSLSLRLELIDLTDFSRRYIEIATMNPDSVKDKKVLLDGDRSSGDFFDLSRSIMKNFCAAQFSEGAPEFWVTLIGGGVRRCLLEGGYSGIVWHGNLPDREGCTLDDMCVRNATNNYTLQVSPSGRYVAFCNPNEFFSVRSLDQQKGASLTLPKIAVTQEGGTPEGPVETHFMGLLDQGRCFGSVTADGRVLVTELETGKTLVDISVLFGTEVTSLEMSPDRSRVLITYYGRESLVVAVADGAEQEIGMLCSVPNGTFLEDGRIVIVESEGAVLCSEDDEWVIYRKDGSVPFSFTLDEDGDIEFYEDENEDADDDDDDYSPSIPEDYLEQSAPVYSSALFTLNGGAYAAMVYDTETADIYAVGTKTIKHVTSFGTNRRTIRADGNVIAVTDTEREYEAPVTIGWFDGKKYKSMGDYKNGKIAAIEICDGEVYTMKAGGKQITAFNPSTGKERTLFTYTGKPLASINLYPQWKCVLLKDVTGRIQYIDWQQKSCRIMSLITGSDGAVEHSQLSTAEIPGSFEEKVTKVTMEKVDKRFRQ